MDIDDSFYLSGPQIYWEYINSVTFRGMRMILKFKSGYELSADAPNPDALADLLEQATKALKPEQIEVIKCSLRDSNP